MQRYLTHCFWVHRSGKSHESHIGDDAVLEVDSQCRNCVSKIGMVMVNVLGLHVVVGRWRIRIIRGVIVGIGIGIGIGVWV